MKTVIQYHPKMNQVVLGKGEFLMEVPFCYLNQYRKIDGVRAVGIAVHTLEVCEDSAEKICHFIQKETDVSYVVVDTEKLESVDELLVAMDLLYKTCQGKNIKVDLLLENSYVEQNGILKIGLFSMGKQLCKMIDELNHKCDTDVFGTCCNMGHFNALGIDTCAAIEEMGERVKLVHMNDNDGYHDMHQLPYSFTTGRADASTDWYRPIRGLFRIGYDGFMSYDLKGLWTKEPAELIPTTIDLVKEIIKEYEQAKIVWAEIMRSDKTKIFFGSGMMYDIFMQDWGEKYAPDLVVDNNPKTWGTVKHGVRIEAPHTILQIPENERNIFIMNLFYDEVGKQLRGMGVKYYEYHEFYY